MNSFPEASTSVDGESAITDGKYITHPRFMARHKPGTAQQGRSVFRSDIDAERATLDAARYADKHNLWVDGKAKVPVSNGHVGYMGKNGTPTNWINVYRRGNGYIHGAPGNPPGKS